MMYERLISDCWRLFIFLGSISFGTAQPKGEYKNHIGCQHKSTSGRAYVGEANITLDGTACQKWTDTKPHEHGFTYLGDHNFCRNPAGTNDQSQVWCFTTDPERRRQNCSVPFCPSLKAIELVMENHWETDEGEFYDYASLKKENLPSSSETEY